MLLVLRCWAQAPKDRPAVAEVAGELAALLRQAEGAGVDTGGAEAAARVAELRKLYTSVAPPPAAAPPP